MANVKFDLGGLDLTFEELASTPESVKAEMLTAAGEVIRSKIQAKGREMGVYDENQRYATEHMIESIKPMKPKTDGNNGSIVVKPDGYRRRGKTTTAHAVIANAAEQGHRDVAARPFFRLGVADAEAEAVEAAAKIYHNWMDGLK